LQGLLRRRRCHIAEHITADIVFRESVYDIYIVWLGEFLNDISVEFCTVLNLLRGGELHHALRGIGGVLATTYIGEGK